MLFREPLSLVVVRLVLHVVPTFATFAPNFGLIYLKSYIYNFCDL